MKDFIQEKLSLSEFLETCRLVGHLTCSCVLERWGVGWGRQVCPRCFLCDVSNSPGSLLSGSPDSMEPKRKRKTPLKWVLRVVLDFRSTEDAHVEAPRYGVGSGGAGAGLRVRGVSPACIFGTCHIATGKEVRVRGLCFFCCCCCLNTIFFHELILAAFLSSLSIGRDEG